MIFARAGCLATLSLSAHNTTMVTSVPSLLTSLLHGNVSYAGRTTLIAYRYFNGEWQVRKVPDAPALV